jgi:hypothetical protein
VEENSPYSPFTIHRHFIHSSRNVNLNSSQRFKVCLKVDRDRHVPAGCPRFDPACDEIQTVKHLPGRLVRN